MNTSTNALLCKAKQVRGRTLVFRDAELCDAEFILSLRTDESKTKYLTKISFDLGRQIAWLKDYENRNDQAYFIIENREGSSIGTVRLYDQQVDSFCWGSWIIKDGAPSGAAIESALMVYAYAFDFLGFRRCHFDVRKKNKRVWRFHERFGAVRTAETEQDYMYQIGYGQIITAQQRYKRYLPEAIIVE